MVVDLQDVGVRCYAYATTAALLCEAAAATGTRMVVCDRPNPLGPRIDGPALDPGRGSFLGYLDVPFQHGRTIGALLAHATRGLGVDLRVAPLADGGGLGGRGRAPAGAFSPGRPREATPRGGRTPARSPGRR